MKLKKILIPLVAIALVVGIVFTAGQIGILFGSINWGDLSDHFVKSEKTVTLTIESTEGGVVSKTEKEYKKGSVVTITATPNTGYIFAGWYSVDDTYLTTAKTYSFTIVKNTVLKTKFAEKPEDMGGKHVSYESLRNCSTDFAFTIVCDREDAETYLLENLTIVDADLKGTEWEEEAKASFTVERVEDTNEYRIVPVTGEEYEAGVTYTAELPEVETEEEPPQATFVETDNTSNTMDFTIVKEETRIVEYNENIVYLVDSQDAAKNQILEVVDDGLAEGMTGDVEDYVILDDTHGITEKTIICVYNGAMNDGLPELGLDSFFGKVKSVEEQANGTFRVVYGTPDLAEVFSKLDIYMNGQANLEEEGVEIGGQAIQEIRAMLLSNAKLQNYVAAAYQTVMNGVAGTGYEVELLSKQNFTDLLDVKILPNIKGDTAEVDIDLAIVIPVKNPSGDQTLYISLKMDMHKSLQVSRHANVKMREIKKVPVAISSYDFNAGITDREDLSFAVAISFDAGMDDFAKLDKSYAEEKFMEEFGKLVNGNKPIAQTIKDSFDASGYAAEADMRVKLFKMRFADGNISYEFDVDMSLAFDIGAAVQFTSTTYNKMIVGINSKSSGTQTYKHVENESKSSDWVLAGNVGVRTGVGLNATIGLAGLAKFVKVDIDFEVGEYATATGYVNLGTQHHAGFAEKGAYWRANVAHKIYNSNGVEDMGTDQYPLFCYGYEKALLGYVSQTDLKKGHTLGMTEKEMALFDLDLLLVKLLNIKTGAQETVRLDPNSDQYTITVDVKDGSYLSYKKGKLEVKNNSPVFFTDEITITVKPKNTKWTSLEEGKCSAYLPTVTMKIEYGNEDAYYDSIDNNMRKEFRSLYRNYQPDNAKFLRDNFSHIISSGIEIPENFQALFDSFVMEYIDQLFATIQSYKNQGDKNRKMENQFVSNEADAFEEVFTFMKKLIEQREFGNNLKIKQILRLVVDSEALYNTLIAVADSEDVETLAEQFAYTDEKTKAKIREELDKYAAGANDREQTLVDSLREILGFTENDTPADQ